MNKIEEFKKLTHTVIGSLTPEQHKFFYGLPDTFWDNLLEKNFNGDIEIAKRTMLEKINEIASIDDVRSDLNAQRLDNLQYAAKNLSEQLLSGKPVLLITDNDNDGSLSQSVANQFIHLEKISGRSPNIIVEFARTVNGNASRGFTKELIEELLEEHNLNADEVLVVTADNGINSIKEQQAVREAFPNMELIITDHHEPAKGMLVEEDQNTIIVNPKYRAHEHQSKEMLAERNPNLKFSDHFDKFNISGASTLSVLLKEVMKDREYELEALKNTQAQLKLLEKVSNILDYVDVAPEDKLQNTADVKRFQGISSSLNLNNSMAKIILQAEATKGHFTMPIGGVEDVPKNIFSLNKQAQAVISLYKAEQARRQEFVNLTGTMMGYSSGDFFDKYSKILTFLPNLEGMEAPLSEIIEEAKAEILGLEEVGLAKFKEAGEKFLKEKNETAKRKSSKLTKTEEEKIKKGIPEFKKAEAIKAFSLTCQNFENQIISSLFQSNNKNYIEQLRPIVFDVMTNSNQRTGSDPFMRDLSDYCLGLFDKLRTEERKILDKLREAPEKIVDVIETDNVSINLVKKEMLGAFNRKLINKAFNGSQKAFTLTLDNIFDNKISGSFRSLYDIEDLIDGIEPILKKHGVNLETPGHKRAAGFILSSEKTISATILKDIADHVESKAKKLNQDAGLSQEEILISPFHLDFLEKFNDAVRGSLPHNEGIHPVLKLNPKMAASNRRTGLIHPIEELVEDKNNGYITLDIELGSEVKPLIIPVEIAKRVIASGVNADGDYNEVVKMRYLNNGAFMVASAEKATHFTQTLLDQQTKTKAIDEAFKDGKNDKPILITREEVKNTPWFKHGTYGKSSFENFENLMVNTINNPANRAKDGFLTVDVEAIGLSNAPMINIGVALWEIIPNSGKTLSVEEFNQRFVKDSRNQGYLVNTEELKPISHEQYLSLVKKQQEKDVLVKDYNGELAYFLYSGEKEKIGNYHVGKTVQYNQEIQCQTLSYLVKEDLQVPISLTHLTGITTEQLQKYGKTISEIEKGLLDFIGNKEVMLNAHNTHYDMNVINANTKDLADKLKSLKINDTTIFSKERVLAYDDMSFAIVQADGVPHTALFPYNLNAEHNLISFLTDKKGSYLDFSGNHKLSFEEGVLYYEYLVPKEYYKQEIDLKQYETEPSPEIKEMNFGNISEELLAKSLNEAGFQKELLRVSSLPPLNLVKFSAQIVSDQMIAKSILLDGVETEPKIVTDFSDYVLFNKKPELLIEFQKGLNLSRNFLVQSIELGLEDMFRDPTNPYKVAKEPKEETIEALEFAPQNFIEEKRKTTSYEADVKKVLKLQMEAREGKILTAEELAYIEQVNAESEFRQNFDKDLSRLNKEWIEKNKEAYNLHQDTWAMRNILKMTDPTNPENFNQDNYELISGQIGLPVEKVEKYLNFAADYCKKYNIYSNPMLAEPHVNGVENGDVVNETITTMSMLANKMSNFNINEGAKLSLANDVVAEAGTRFTHKYVSRVLMKSLTEIPADDSTGFIQAELYQNRQVISDDIAEMLYRRSTRENTNEEFVAGEYLVKFKSDNTLPQDNYVVGLPIKPISQEQILEDAKKIGYVQKVLQINQSEDLAILSSDLFNPQETVKEIKEDLATRYAYLEFDRNPAEMKYFLNYLTSPEAPTDRKTDNALSILPSRTHSSSFSLGQIEVLRDVAESVLRAYENSENYKFNVDIKTIPVEEEHPFYAGLPNHIKKALVFSDKLDKEVEYCTSIDWRTSNETAIDKYQRNKTATPAQDMLLDCPIRKESVVYGLKHGFLTSVLPQGLSEIYQQHQLSEMLEQVINISPNELKRTI